MVWKILYRNDGLIGVPIGPDEGRFPSDIHQRASTGAAARQADIFKKRCSVFRVAGGPPILR